MGHVDPDTCCVKAYCASMNKSTPDIHFPQKEWNTFSVRTAGGKLTYDVNGRTMAASHDLASLLAGIFGPRLIRSQQGED